MHTNDNSGVNIITTKLFLLLVVSAYLSPSAILRLFDPLCRPGIILFWRFDFHFFQFYL